MSEIRDPYSLDDLLRVMERLRDPETGCPWDIAQDFDSIVTSTLEECYELVAAIESGDFPHVAEELGDVLFQVIFYAQLGREKELFSFATIVDVLVDKLVRRHPHVFAEAKIEGVVAQRSSIANVKKTWEEIKQRERVAKSRPGALDDVPQALPALPRAQKLQKRAAQVGFDWPDASAVLGKVDEELAELRHAMEQNSHAAIEEELGDLLFSCVNLARHLNLDAESSLRRSSAKFQSRFEKVEELATARGEMLEVLDEAALDRLWRLAKASELGS